MLQIYLILVSYFDSPFHYHCVRNFFLFVLMHHRYYFKEEAKQETFDEEEMNAENFGEHYSSRNGNCCNQLLVIATVVIFVAKLEYDVGPGSNDGFSAFWVAFPLLFFPVSK